MDSECSRRCFIIRSAGLAAGMAVGGIGLGGCNKQSERGAAVNEVSEMIAYCGIDCVECPIYLATRETNSEKKRQMREQIVIAIKKYLGEEKRLEDITDCDGCGTQGERLYPGCRKCQVRKCASEKHLKNCAYCSEYACEKLKKFFDTEDKAGKARKRLDEIKARL